MKKKHVIIGMAMVLLAGCSSGDDLLAEQPAVPAAESLDDENLSREDLMGDVSIEFAGVNFGADVEVEESKAPRRVSINNIFSTEQGSMGIFCLSSTKIGDAVADDAILRSWSGHVGATLNMLNLWQDNVKAHADNVSGNEGKIVWDDPNTPHYYPNKDYFNYSFAAYHPYTDVIAREKNIVYAYIPMDGDDDVMYAFADAPRSNVNDDVDALAYSNSYFKGVVNAGQTVTDDHKPYFNFRHLASKLNFTVKLKEATAATAEHQFHVDSICLTNVVNIMRLSLAKNTGSSAVAASYSIISSTTSLPDSIQEKLGDYNGHGTFWLRDTDGTSISEKKDNNGDYVYVINTSSSTPIGDCILIPPTSSAKLSLQVFLRDEDGNRYTTLSPMSISVPSTGKWEAGKSYTINITMTAPTYYTEARGEITDWETETTEINVTDNEE